MHVQRPGWGIAIFGSCSVVGLRWWAGVYRVCVCAFGGFLTKTEIGSSEIAEALTRAASCTPLEPGVAGRTSSRGGTPGCAETASGTVNAPARSASLRSSLASRSWRCVPRVESLRSTRICAPHRRNQGLTGDSGTESTFHICTAIRRIDFDYCVCLKHTRCRHTGAYFDTVLISPYLRLSDADIICPQAVNFAWGPQAPTPTSQPR